MKLYSLGTARTFLAILLLTIMGQATAPAPKQWEVVTGKSFAIAVPKDWRDLAAMGGPAMVVYRQGDGIGLPAMDETGEPLQIGLTVEKINTKDSIKDGIAALTKSAKSNPRLELVGTETVETIKLADGTEAMILITEFIKEGSRRSLQMKMLVAGKDNEWVVSGFLVGGKTSKIPTKGSELALFLRAHMQSFVLDEKKLDETEVKAAWGKNGK